MNYNPILKKLRDSPVVILILIVLGVDVDSVEKLLQMDPTTISEVSEWVKNSVSNEAWLKVTAFFGWLTYLYKVADKVGDKDGRMDQGAAKEDNQEQWVESSKETGS